MIRAKDIKIIKECVIDCRDIALDASNKIRKKIKICKVRLRILHKLKREPKRTKPFAEPRYDEVYFRGVEWLNTL